MCSLLPGSRLRTSGLMFCRSVPATPPTPHPEQDQEVPPTPTASRHVLVLLTWWPKGSLRKGRCQITYSLSYLSKGRTSALAWRPRPLPPTPCHQCPRPQSSEPRPGTRFQAHTETHLHPSRSQSLRITKSTSGKFSNTHILLEKQKCSTNSSATWEDLFPPGHSGEGGHERKSAVPTGKTGHISVSTETIGKQGLWLYSSLGLITENSPSGHRH